MKFDKDFNPGAGTSFNEWNIQHVENLNPNATSVTTIHNHYYGKEKTSGGRESLHEEQKAVIQDDIMEYVGRLSDHVNQDWKTKYASLWEKILAIPEVDEAVYNPGRQKGTSFNRNLVGNIITMLKGTVYKGNPTDFARTLEGTDRHSIREEMGNKPSAEIQKAVLALLV